jgi:uncharacterized protein YjcR
MTTNDKMTNREPWGYTNYLQAELSRQGKDVEGFVGQMNNMTDEEIASELGCSVNQARDYKREFNRGEVASQIVVD